MKTFSFVIVGLAAGTTVALADPVTHDIKMFAKTVPHRCEAGECRSVCSIKTKITNIYKLSPRLVISLEYVRTDVDAVGGLDISIPPMNVKQTRKESYEIPVACTLLKARYSPRAVKCEGNSMACATYWNVRVNRVPQLGLEKSILSLQ